jgi:type IV pilus assembly protein PilC
VLHCGKQEYEINSGVPLWTALENSKKFSVYEVYSVRIAEETNRLKEIAFELNLYFAKRIKQRRLLMSALSYPILILSTAVLAVYFMLIYLIPMFESVFMSFDSELPALTRFVFICHRNFLQLVGF